MDSIAVKRATAGIINDLVQVAFDHHDNTGSWSGVDQVLYDHLTAKALERFEPKIRAGFERAGVALPDGPLTVAGMKQIIGERIGVDPADLTPDGIKTALDAKLSAAVSEDTGLSIGSVLGQGIKDAIKAEVIRAIVDGRAAGLLNKYLMHRARKLAALKQEGYASKEEQRKVLLRLYQKRYRSRNRQVWDK